MRNLDINSFKKALEKARGNNLIVFLFFLLVSCSLWLSMTLNRVYETNISVSVQVKNVPDGIELECADGISTSVVVRGDGTDLFGYIFDDGIVVAADYSEFSRKGGRLAMSANTIRGRVVEQLDPSLSLKDFVDDSLFAAVQRVTAIVPVKKNRLDLRVAKGCELVSVKYEPEEVLVTALIDEISEIKDVRTPVLVCDGLERDTVFEMTFLPGKYINVQPEKVKVLVGVSRYVNKVVAVPVEYVKFPSNVNLGFLPQDVNVVYEVLDADSGKVKPSDFSVQLQFDDYAYSVILGKRGDLEKRFEVSTNSPFVRKAKVVGVESSDTASFFNSVATAL